MASIRKLIPGNRDIKPPRSEVDAYYQRLRAADGTLLLCLYNYAEIPGATPTQSLHLDRSTAESLVKVLENTFPGGSQPKAAATRQALRTFVAERDWDQFHSPENLAKSISIEAAELLECFQWSPDFDQARVEEELADVVTYCIQLANKIGVDLDEIVMSKLAKTEEKYPVELTKGRATKYTELAADQDEAK